jgi:hemolysin III
MGWLAIARVDEIWSALTPSGRFYLLAGGMSYTLGACVYAFKWPRLFQGVFGFHELWHIAVLMGFGFHFLLVLGLY